MKLACYIPGSSTIIIFPVSMAGRNVHTCSSMAMICLFDGRQQSEQTDTHGQNFAIGELGFGTGLNFLETWRQWRDIRQPGQHLSFLSVEGFPLAAETAGQALKNWPELGALSARLLERWDQLTSPMQLDDQTRLQVLQGDGHRHGGSISSGGRLVSRRIFSG